MRHAHFVRSFVLLGSALALAGCARSHLSSESDGSLPPYYADSGLPTGVDSGQRDAGTPIPTRQTIRLDSGTRGVDAAYVDAGFDALRCDYDFDGFFSYECGGVDCDDYDPAVSPFGYELCSDGRDNDCNGLYDCEEPACTGARECQTLCASRSDCVYPECYRQPICGGCLDGVTGPILGILDRSVLNGVTDPVGDVVPSCGLGAGPTRTYLWTAPYTGAFAFAVDGRGIPATLSLHLAECGGDEIACASLPTASERVVTELSGGDSIYVTVQFLPMEIGAFELSVNPWTADDTCPAEVFFDTIDISDDTSRRANHHQPSCVDGIDAPDVTYAFTATRGGVYEFSTRGSDFDTVLSVLPYCGGPDYDCNDDTLPGVYSTIQYRLGAFQTIYVVVDGYGGGRGPVVLRARRIGD